MSVLCREVVPLSEGPLLSILGPTNYDSYKLLIAVAIILWQSQVEDKQTYSVTCNLINCCYSKP